MLDLIPIIFVITALVGMVILVARHLPEIRQVQSVNVHPSWTGGFKFGAFAWSILRKTGVILRQIQRALLFAKSEFKNSTDIARHLSDTVRHRLERRKIKVKVIEAEPENKQTPSDLDRASQLLEAGNFTESEEVVITIIKQNPTFKPAYELLGRIYLARRSFAEAAEVYRYLLKGSPKSEKYWQMLGHALVEAKDYRGAVRAYIKSVEYYPNSEVFVALGIAYQANSDYASAGKAFDSALDLDPENTQVLMLLADNLTHRGERESAREVLEQILELEPGNVVARERLMKM